jgi:hypothetical protein
MVIVGGTVGPSIGNDVPVGGAAVFGVVVVGSTVVSGPPAGAVVVGPGSLDPEHPGAINTIAPIARRRLLR